MTPRDVARALEALPARVARRVNVYPVHYIGADGALLVMTNVDWASVDGSRWLRAVLTPSGIAWSGSGIGGTAHAALLAALEATA